LTELNQRQTHVRILSVYYKTTQNCLTLQHVLPRSLVQPRRGHIGPHIDASLLYQHSAIVLPPRTCQFPSNLDFWCQSSPFSVFPAFAMQYSPPYLITIFLLGM